MVRLLDAVCLIFMFSVFSMFLGVIIGSVVTRLEYLEAARKGILEFKNEWYRTTRVYKQVGYSEKETTKS